MSKKNEQCRQNLKTMIIMREFERVIKDLANEGFVDGAVHCYTGEEACALGVCLNLNDEDYVFSTHRGHGHAIAKGLLKSVIRDNTPCIFMENRNLYYDPVDIPEEEYLIPLGKASVRQEGNDLTIVTYGIGVPVCEKAIKKMPKASVELIDLRTIVPLDFETVLNSVKKTGRLLIVHEATAGFSVGSEIVRRVVEKGFDYLDAEPLVYGNLRAAMPFAANLEDAVLINPEGVLEKMRYLLTGVC